MLPATLPPPNTKWRQVLPHFEKNQVSYILCLDKIFRQIEKNCSDDVGHCEVKHFGGKFEKVVT